MTGLVFGGHLTGKVVREAKSVRRIGSPRFIVVGTARFQLGFARGAPKPCALLLIILDKADSSPTNLAGMEILVRPDPPFSDAEQFLQSVANWFAARAQAARPSLEEEPERLLEIGSTRAAVIAALTLLEVELRKRLDLTTVPRPMSTSQLVRLASTNGIIGAAALDQIQSWLKIRNTAVHTPKPISMDEARPVVRGVRDLFRKINE